MKDKTAGVFLLTRDNDYQRLQETEALATARRLKVPITVSFAENEARLQVKQIEDFVDTHPADSVVIGRRSMTSRSLVAAHRAAELGGVSSCTVRLRTCTGYAAISCLAMSMVTADHKELFASGQAIRCAAGRGTVLYVRAAGNPQPTIAGRHERNHQGRPSTATSCTAIDEERRGEGRDMAQGVRRNHVALRLVGCRTTPWRREPCALSPEERRCSDATNAHIPVTESTAPEHGIPMVDRHRLAATVIITPAWPRHRARSSNLGTPGSRHPFSSAPVRSYPASRRRVEDGKSLGRIRRGL